MSEYEYATETVVDIAQDIADTTGCDWDVAAALTRRIVAKLSAAVQAAIATPADFGGVE